MNAPTDSSAGPANGRILPLPLLRQAGMLPTPTLIVVTTAAAMLLYMFTVYPAYPTTGGKHLAGWTWAACNAKNESLHGRFIPFAFLAMLAIAWKATKNEKIAPSYWGLLCLGVGLLMYLVSIRTIQPRLALIGVPFVIIGFTQFTMGTKIARAIIFPAFFFWFTIPVPGLGAALTGNLQIFITKSCYFVGTLVGMDLTSTGSTITVNGRDLEIAEGCSGIRSLMALVMIAAVYANYTQKSLWKKAVVFASSLPLAIIGNFGRIFTILIFAQLGFGEFGSQTYHDWAGLLIFFPIALSGLYLVDYLLNFKTRRKKQVTRAMTRKKPSTNEIVQ